MLRCGCVPAVWTPTNRLRALFKEIDALMEQLIGLREQMNGLEEVSRLQTAPHAPPPALPLIPPFRPSHLTLTLSIRGLV